jgi:glycosyltransferase involved in cell wall biosynthesis
MDGTIDVSVVMPCLNEEQAVGVCIKKIQDVFTQQSIKGEIIVADNGSVDRSRAIAEALGARVVVELRRGYGSAYLAGIKEAKGKYILIADSDDTYDFYEMPRFLEALEKGYDFVIGSRFKGVIKQGAMHWTHRYLGNPILSGMARLFFHTRLSDIHCGLRAFTAEAYRKMNLMTLGMEFATEMVVSALLNGLAIREIPITYYPRAGTSKLSPFADAWRHIRFMLLFCPQWLYFIPGAAGFLAGIASLFILCKGPVLFLGHYWDVHFMIYASLLCILSYQVLHLGVYARTFALRQGFLKYDRLTLFFKRTFNLERGLLLGGVISLTGLVILLVILLEWFSRHFGPLDRIRESVLGVTLLMIGLQTVFSSFFISLLFIERK